MKLKRILSLVLILCLAFTFVSCKKDLFARIDLF